MKKFLSILLILTLILPCEAAFWNKKDKIYLCDIKVYMERPVATTCTLKKIKLSIRRELFLFMPIRQSKATESRQNQFYFRYLYIIYLCSQDTFFYESAAINSIQ